jgi:SLT domain-containing protein
VYPFAKGGVVDKATLALIGEAGKEVVIPVTRATRAAALVAQSGLADIPQVQRVIMDRLRLSLSDIAPSGLSTSPALSQGAKAALSGQKRSTTSTSTSTTAVKQNVRNVTNNNTIVMPPVYDPNQLADAFLARISAAER